MRKNQWVVEEHKRRTCLKALEREEPPRETNTPKENLPKSMRTNDSVEPRLRGRTCQRAKGPLRRTNPQKENLHESMMKSHREEPRSTCLRTWRRTTERNQDSDLKLYSKILFYWEYLLLWGSSETKVKIKVSGLALCPAPSKRCTFFMSCWRLFSL